MPSLRPALDVGGLVVAPGVYDGLTARLAAQHGFPALYMTGAGTAAAGGYPDYGLLTMSEMVANAARIAEAVDVPVIADADTGYGNELNVVRTVRAYAKAGVAALHIEDQAFPKRCGHLAGKEIVAPEEWLGKIRAAVECRPDNDLVVIARTDARSRAAALPRLPSRSCTTGDTGWLSVPGPCCGRSSPPATPLSAPSPSGSLSPRRSPMRARPATVLLPCFNVWARRTGTHCESVSQPLTGRASDGHDDD
jgi:hypothetical protein